MFSFFYFTLIYKKNQSIFFGSYENYSDSISGNFRVNMTITQTNKNCITYSFLASPSFNDSENSSWDTFLCRFQTATCCYLNPALPFPNPISPPKLSAFYSPSFLFFSPNPSKKLHSLHFIMQNNLTFHLGLALFALIKFHRFHSHSHTQKSWLKLKNVSHTLLLSSSVFIWRKWEK